MIAARLAGALRRRLWLSVCRLSGGLTVGGRWQTSGGCVLVANHSSHLDSAALLAALPSAAAPMFGAAADYWFDRPVRRFVATRLVGALPVPRYDRDSYAVLLAGARRALAAGHVVVLYPEGTRSPDGRVGEFHSGALRLARDCGVPVVPAAVIGTAAVLPKGGRLTPAPMRVELGQPLDPHRVSTPRLRAEVVALLAGCPAAVADCEAA